MQTLKYKPHKISAIFPSMTEDEKRELEAAIKKDGLIEPIVLYEGEVLDGVHRQEACLKAGVEPRYVEFNRLPSASRAGGPLNYVVSKNLRRRHLTIGQRAIIAANLANTTHGGDRKSDQAANSAFNSQSAAKAMGVSKRSVERAKKVMRESPKRVPEIAAGKVTVAKVTAEIRTFTQRRLELEAAQDRIREVCGKELGDAVRMGIRLKRPKDVLAFAGMDDAEMKRLQILIEDGWPLKKARLYKAKNLTLRHVIEDLFRKAALNEGNLSVDIDGWRIGVTRLKIHALT